MNGRWSSIALSALLCCSQSTRAEEFGSDWATVLEEFVDKKVPVLTKDYAEKDLQKRWMDAFLGPFTRVSIVQDDVVRRVRISVQFPAGQQADVATSLALLRSLEADLSAIRFDISRLNTVEVELTNLQTACDNDQVVGAQAVSSVGALAIANVELPGGPFYAIAWDPTWISTVVSLVYDVWAWYDDDSKRKRARAAFDRMPSRIFSVSEATILSRQLCKAIYAERASSISEYIASVRVYKAALSNQESEYWGAYRDVQGYFVDAAFKDVLQRSGIWKTEVEHAQSRASAQLLLDIELENNELKALKAEAEKATGCRRGISSVERYEDALIELAAQIAEFSKLPQLPEVSGRMDELSKAAAAQKLVLPLTYKAAKARSC